MGHPASDAYDWLLQSYIWRFSTDGRLGSHYRADAGASVDTILKGTNECARYVDKHADGRLVDDATELERRKDEFREIVFRIVNNLRRVEEQIDDVPPSARDALELLWKEYEVNDPREQGLGRVVDWAASNTSSSGLGEEANPDINLTVIVQRRMEPLMEDAEEGRFLAEAFIAKPNWIRWTCDDLEVETRPPIQGAAGCHSGDLGVSFTHTRYGEPKEYQHDYRYDMTWSPREYRFDFELQIQNVDRASFAIDRGFVRGEKRLGHPGDTVITVQREAWMGGHYQSLNVYMPALMRIQMFDALLVWMKYL